MMTMGMEPTCVIITSFCTPSKGWVNVHQNRLVKTTSIQNKNSMLEYHCIVWVQPSASTMQCWYSHWYSDTIWYQKHWGHWFTVIYGSSNELFYGRVTGNNCVLPIKSHKYIEVFLMCCRFWILLPWHQAEKQTWPGKHNSIWWCVVKMYRLEYLFYKEIGWHLTIRILIWYNSYNFSWHVNMITGNKVYESNLLLLYR